MINANKAITFNLDRDDRENIKNAINTIESVLKAFESVGYTEIETNLLSGAAHTLDEILRGENF